MLAELISNGSCLLWGGSAALRPSTITTQSAVAFTSMLFRRPRRSVGVSGLHCKRHVLNTYQEPITHTQYRPLLQPRSRLPPRSAGWSVAKYRTTPNGKSLPSTRKDCLLSGANADWPVHPSRALVQLHSPTHPLTHALHVKMTGPYSSNTKTGATIAMRTDRPPRPLPYSPTLISVSAVPSSRSRA
jgi:hypothetical protein